MRPWFEADWPAPRGVRVLSTLRGGAGAGGVGAGGAGGAGGGGAGGAGTARYASFNLAGHVGDDLAAVAENRRRLVAEAGLPGEPQWLAQVHGTAVADLDRGDPVSPADAAITRASGTVCAILTADCLPVVLVSRSGETLAAAHAGWRGLAAGVLEATVRAMRTPGTELMAWLGPAIGPLHFEVGGEVREAFLKDDPGAEEAFALNPKGRFMAHLERLARRRLERLGVTRIYGGGECTFSEKERYYSHRRDGITGRQATLIWRQG
ncbi:MAG TPA: peptidoglycan editing factor PgeF [Steroidobacteraceae bacterium]|jgi:hypothetical protein|nr:peptidoglycan editing factor PgeF [Steroidobacteraceae bacterium]